MTANATDNHGWRGNRWRLAAWGIVALILLLPLVVMQFTEEVKWSLTDFAFAGALLIGMGIMFELAVRSTGNRAYRAAVGVALAAVFMLIWFTGAVGIIGSEDEPANLLYGGVVAVGIVGAALTRFQPSGLARTLLAMALGQALIGAVAVAAGWGSTDPLWPLDVLALTGFFVLLFVGSALLFRQAARDQSLAGAAN